MLSRKTSSRKSSSLFATTFGLVFILALSCAAWAQKEPAVRQEMLVSTQWLADHLKDPKLVIIHIGEKREEYDQEHIPGARYVAIDEIMLEHVGAMSELPTVEKLKQVFEDLGVGDDSHVVIYTTAWFPLAARGYYTLDFLGHGDQSALLDGGIEQWKLEKKPLSTEPVTPKKAEFTPHVKAEVRAMLDEVEKILKDGESGKALLVDSRPKRRYVSGHISGATNVYWQDTLVSKDSPVLLPVADLRKLMESRGLTPGHKLVTYCEVGQQASHGYFLAKYLGYDAAMYDGSYYEWNEMKHNPVVKGEAKK